MSNRIAATEFIIKYIDKLLPGSENPKLLRQSLEAMSDEEFDAYMGKLERGEEIIPLYAPNLGDKKLSVERNLKVAEELGHNFLQRIWWTDPSTGMTYLTPERYLVILLPLRRQIQLLQKKISIPEDNKHVDELTGQPAGASASSKLSFPELQVLFSQGLDRSIEELIKFRGGDSKAFNAMNRDIIDKGGVSLDSVAISATKVKSTQTLSTFLKTMHLDNNL